MAKPVFDPDVLADNLRCKVIYYSCINPNTISDLNRAWGYGSPTYLYQNDSLETLKDADLITVEEEDGKNIIRSNYDALFDEENLQRSRDYINGEIVKEFLIHAKGFQPKQEHRQDEQDLMGIARGNLDDELEQHLQAIEFDADDFATLTALWRNDLFREVFLDLDITAQLFSERKGELPDNPANYLFKLTAGLMTSMARGRNEGRLEIPRGLRYRAERILVPAYRSLDTAVEQEHMAHPELVAAMKDTYSLFRAKFREDRFDHGFIQDFVDLTMQGEGEKKFGKLFDRYRGDDGGLF